MVCSFGGRHFPGTPDGMFESWDGALTCVQVVRVPLVVGSTLLQMQETLAYTVLTKVVKSQHWLSASHVVPNDFVIFCWLPFAVPPACAEHAEVLMRQVQNLDPRFSLRLRLPAEPGALFPALFAQHHDLGAQKARGYSWSDVATYNSSDSASAGESEALEWDITWAWEEEAVGGGEAEAEEETSGDEVDDDLAPEWDITWAWDFDLSFASEECGSTKELRLEQQQGCQEEAAAGHIGVRMGREDSCHEGDLVLDDNG